MSHNIDFTTSTVSATMTAGNGLATNVTLNKISLGGGLFIVTGIVGAAASSVTAGSRTSVKLSFSSPFTVLGGVCNIYQNTAADSYTLYCRVAPTTGAVDGYCYTSISTNTLFWINYFAIGKES